MNLFKTPEFKVGLLVLVVSAAVGWISMNISEDPSYFGSSRSLVFHMDDASGLIEGSPIYLAGIRVGVIRSIELNKGRARVVAVLQDDLQLTTSTKVEVRPSGILGDKNVVLIPGDPNDPLLGHGGEIMEVKDTASIDKVVAQVGEIAENIKAVAENVRKATEGDTATSLGRIIANLENLTGNLSELSSQHREDISKIIADVRGITSGLNHFVGDTSENGFQAGWDKLVASLGNVEKTLSNFEEISDKINRGEGTLGRLVNDETTIEEINTAVAGINEFIGAGQRLKTSLDFNSSFMTAEDGFKTAVGIKIQPGLDRYYLVQVVDTPEGALEERQIFTTIDNNPTVREERREYFKQKVRFTALFGKNFHNVTLKGGMIESSGGFGMDLHFFRRKLSLIAEAYDLGDVRGRSYLKYNIMNGFYVQAGADDLFNDEFKSVNSFFGLGLFLDNDDIKALLSKVSL